MTTLRRKLLRAGLVALAAVVVAMPMAATTASASDGNWRFAEPFTQTVAPGTFMAFTPSLFCWDSVTCDWTPTMTLTATALDGAQFYSNPGDVQELTLDGAPIGSCSVTSPTTWQCTFTGAGTADNGDTILSSGPNPAMFGVPASAPAGSTVVSLSWTDNPITNNTNTADDVFTFTVSDEAPVPFAQPLIAVGTAGALGLGWLAFRRRIRLRPTA